MQPHKHSQPKTYIQVHVYIPDNKDNKAANIAYFPDGAIAAMQNHNEEAFLIDF